MELFGNYNLNKSIKFLVLLKFFAYIYLTWNPHNDMCANINSVEIKFKHDKTCNTIFYRLLAKHELKSDLYKTHVRQNYTDYGMHKYIKNGAEKKSTYSQVKGKSLNELDAYKQGYKHRYSKKKGLAKLDCYYEKKIFDKIKYINDLSIKMKNKKKSFSIRILTKYSILFILFFLLPFLGLIFPILFGGDRGSRIINWCGIPDKYKSHKFDDSNIENAWHITKNDLLPYAHLNIIISCILIIIVFFVIMYTFIKVIKYEKLKIGKGNMSSKVYYPFCRDVFKTN
ncbi:Plasmodium exported protein, unknown function [Plasmodium vivax]|nr:Plasmodium exported protein, unknown function [Plasmodium vivax]